jgi:hypothetical protein
VRRRANVNRARAKTWEREVPADAGLIRLYSDYLHEEYGPLDCDYVLSGLRDNTYCPEPGVIQTSCPETASDRAVFAGEVRIIS